MKIETRTKDSFVVIGKEGSTRDGDGFIQRLWQDANIHFDEISDLAKRDESGNLVGIWGAMTDFSRSFKPWDDFNRGLYLAGAECRDDAEAPEGWVKWVLPAYDYLVVEREGDNTFSEMCRTSFRDRAISGMKTFVIILHYPLCNFTWLSRIK